MATIGNDIRSRPNDCTYWVSTRFLAGEYPTFSYGTEQETRRKLGAYLDHGVRTFVDLTQQGEKQDYVDLLQEEATKRNIPNVQYHRISIPDFGIPSSKQVMKVVLDTIDRGMEEKDAGVYVHCRGGIGRTGTTVGCWLVRNAGLTGEAALAETNRLFQSSSRSRESSCSPETRDQMEFVRTWNED
jgi:protein tyrosine/serine phosphatase